MTLPAIPRGVRKHAGRPNPESWGRPPEGAAPDCKRDGELPDAHEDGMVKVFGMGDLLSFSVPQFGLAGARVCRIRILFEVSQVFFSQKRTRWPAVERILASRRRAVSGRLTRDSVRYSGREAPKDPTWSPVGVGHCGSSERQGRPPRCFGIKAPDPVVGGTSLPASKTRREWPFPDRLLPPVIRRGTYGVPRDRRA